MLYVKRFFVLWIYLGIFHYLYMNRGHISFKHSGVLQHLIDSDRGRVSGHPHYSSPLKTHQLVLRSSLTSDDITMRTSIPRTASVMRAPLSEKVLAPHASPTALGRLHGPADVTQTTLLKPSTHCKQINVRTVQEPILLLCEATGETFDVGENSHGFFPAFRSGL
jgi:hypothetical protein